MEKKEKEAYIPNIGSLFTSQNSRNEEKLEKIIEIPIDNIDNFSNHPYQVNEDAELIKLSESILENGILVPAIVRPKNDGRYEMISGHRRKKASELIGKITIRCVVRELNDDEAAIMMVDSNMQREKLLASEKAFAYKMKLDAIKHQGKKLKVTSCQIGTKLRSDDELAKQYEESSRTIQRYIRLTYLIPELLELVDNKTIALTPAESLSFLKHDEQIIVLDKMQYYDCSPSTKQAKELKSLSEKGLFNEESVKKILETLKQNQIDFLKLNKNRFMKIMPKMDVDRIEDYLYKAVQYYNAHLQNRVKKDVQER